MDSTKTCCTCSEEFDDLEQIDNVVISGDVPLLTALNIVSTDKACRNTDFICPACILMVEAKYVNAFVHSYINNISNTIKEDNCEDDQLMINDELDIKVEAGYAPDTSDNVHTLQVSQYNQTSTIDVKQFNNENTIIILDDGNLMRNSIFPQVIVLPQLHYRTVTDTVIPIPPALKCGYCTKTFGNEDELDNHEKIHTGLRQRCTRCLLVFDIDELGDHYATAHNIKFTCFICQISFHQPNLLNRHLEIHKIDGKYTCPICSWEFKSCRDLKKHSITHLEKNEYFCKICNKGFKDQNALTLHMVSHTGQKNISCKMCGERFIRFPELLRHEEARHGIQIFKCNKCKKPFKTDESFNKHMKLHEDDKMSCHICGREYNRRKLKAHLETHSDKLSYFCYICGKGFKSRGLIRSHVEIHTEIRMFRCKICGKKFKTQATLTSHKYSTHAKEKPFVCEFCGKGFTRKDYLQKHKTMHTGEKRYSCDICGQRFSRRSNCLVHIKQHSEENPYKCEICALEFKDQIKLTRHKKKHQENTNSSGTS